MENKEVEKILSIARNKIGEDLNIIDQSQFAFCWIVDYPMFELDDKKKLYLVIILFLCHKEISKSRFTNPLAIKAFQYDIVCNGVELSSGP